MHDHPNLFVIGSEKGGSTTLTYHLTGHPEIEFFSEKEPNLFAKPNAAACRKALANETRRGSDSCRYLLDGTVNYSKHPQYDHVPENIAEICGLEAPRMIYILRQPVERAISHYFWRRERYGEDRSIDAALTEDSQYILSSHYDMQIARYLSVFPAERLRFLVFESYFKDVAPQFAQICNWLEIDASHVPDADLARGATNKQMSRKSRLPIVNRIAQSSPALRQAVRSVLPHKYQMKLVKALSKEVPREEVTPETRARLQSYFTESIEKTEELIGQDLSHWKTG